MQTDAALREASAHWSVRQAWELVAWHRAQREAAASPESAGGMDGQDCVEGSGEGVGEGARPEAAKSASAAREFERRTLRFNDTRRTVRIVFTKDDYATAKSALVTRVAADERAADERTAGASTSDKPVSPDPLGYVPYDQRLYDTLMLLFRVGAAPASRGGPVVRPRVIVHAPVELLLSCSSSGSGVGAEVAEIEGVGPIPAEVARRLACDAHVVLSVESPDGSILDQGRARRHPTVAQRIEIARRDKGCRFPGCTFTEIHRRAPRPALGSRRSDGPRQSGHTVRPAPPRRSRVGVGHRGGRQRGGVLHQPARQDHEVGAVADLAEDVAGPRRSRWAAASLIAHAGSGHGTAGRTCFTVRPPRSLAVERPVRRAVAATATRWPRWRP